MADLLPLLHRHLIPAAYTVLPEMMHAPAATAMLLTIALQESRCTRRRQVNGPARGFWQFEAAGLAGVRSHPASRDHLKRALASLSYAQHLAVSDARVAVEHNDVLAAVYARLLLWTLPDQLPGRLDVNNAWGQYLSAWRPGKPHAATWPAYYAQAWNLVEPLPIL